MGEANRRWLLRGGVVAVAVVVALVAWLASGDDEEAPAPAPTATEETSRIVSAAELGDVAAVGGHPVYWAGPMSGTALALTEEPEGNIQVRYLDDEAELAEEGTAHLTVGSYPIPDPAAAIDSLAAQPGSTVKRSPSGVELVSSEESPSSVYFASPDNSVQVEVYDPSPQRAMALALSGRVRPAD